MALTIESLMRDSVVAEQRSTATEFLSFLFVGGMGAISFVGLSALMIDLGTGLPAWLVSALCWAVLIGPVYLGHRLVSFRSSVPHARALPRYVAVQAAGLSLAALFSYVAFELVGASSLLGAMLVAGLTAGVNFAVLKLWAFARG